MSSQTIHWRCGKIPHNGRYLDYPGKKSTSSVPNTANSDPNGIMSRLGCLPNVSDATTSKNRRSLDVQEHVEASRDKRDRPWNNQQHYDHPHNPNNKFSTGNGSGNRSFRGEEHRGRANCKAPNRQDIPNNFLTGTANKSFDRGEQRVNPNKKFTTGNANRSFNGEERRGRDNYKTSSRQNHPNKLVTGSVNKSFGGEEQRGNPNKKSLTGNRNRSFSEEEYRCRESCKISNRQNLPNKSFNGEEQHGIPNKKFSTGDGNRSFSEKEYRGRDSCKTSNRQNIPNNFLTGSANESFGRGQQRGNSHKKFSTENHSYREVKSWNQAHSHTSNGRDPINTFSTEYANRSFRGGEQRVEVNRQKFSAPDSRSQLHLGSQTQQRQYAVSPNVRSTVEHRRGRGTEQHQACIVPHRRRLVPQKKEIDRILKTQELEACGRGSGQLFGTLRGETRPTIKLTENEKCMLLAESMRNMQNLDLTIEETRESDFESDSEEQQNMSLPEFSSDSRFEESSIRGAKCFNQNPNTSLPLTSSTRMRRIRSQLFVNVMTNTRNNKVRQPEQTCGVDARPDSRRSHRVHLEAEEHNQQSRMERVNTKHVKPEAAPNVASTLRYQAKQVVGLYVSNLHKMANMPIVEVCGSKDVFWDSQNESRMEMPPFFQYQLHPNVECIPDKPLDGLYTHLELASFEAVVDVFANRGDDPLAIGGRVPMGFAANSKSKPHHRSFSGPGCLHRQVGSVDHRKVSQREAVELVTSQKPPQPSTRRPLILPPRVKVAKGDEVASKCATLPDSSIEKSSEDSIADYSDILQQAGHQESRFLSPKSPMSFDEFRPRTTSTPREKRSSSIVDDDRSEKVNPRSNATSTTTPKRGTLPGVARRMGSALFVWDDHQPNTEPSGSGETGSNEQIARNYRH